MTKEQKKIVRKHNAINRKILFWDAIANVATVLGLSKLATKAALRTIDLTADGLLCCNEYLATKHK